MINAYETSGSSPGRKNVLETTPPDFSTHILTTREAVCYKSPFTITALNKQADVSLLSRSLNGKIYDDSADADLIDAYQTSGSSPGSKNAFCVSGNSPTCDTSRLYRCTSVLRHSSQFKSLPRHAIGLFFRAGEGAERTVMPNAMNMDDDLRRPSAWVTRLNEEFVHARNAMHLRQRATREVSEMLQNTIVGNELFEPTTLKQLLGLFRGIARETDDAFTIHMSSRAWMLIDAALEGNGLDTEDLIEIVNHFGIEILHPKVFQRAEAEANILYSRNEAGLCVCCGINRQLEHSSDVEAIN